MSSPVFPQPVKAMMYRSVYVWQAYLDYLSRSSKISQDISIRIRNPMPDIPMLQKAMLTLHVISDHLLPWLVVFTHTLELCAKTRVISIENQGRVMGDTSNNKMGSFLYLYCVKEFEPERSLNCQSIHVLTLV